MLDGKFIRGTTPTHTFELPIALDFVRYLTITYKQDGEVLVKRRLEDCDVHENIVAVTLDQQESLSFLPDEIAEVQLKLLTKGGRVVASPTYRIAVEDALDTEVFDI